MAGSSLRFKPRDHVVFLGDWHDLVRPGDVGVVEEILDGKEAEFYRELWNLESPPKYRVSFSRTVLLVSEEELVSEDVGALLFLEGTRLRVPTPAS